MLKFNQLWRYSFW